MFRDLYARFRGGCMKLFRREGEEVAFIGTAFLVHSEGYLLTTAHILYSRENLMVAPAQDFDDFSPMSAETVVPLPADVVAIDKDRDQALLKFHHEIDINMPDHLIGVPGSVSLGSSAVCIGFAYGFYNIYTQVVQQSVISSKFISPNGTNLILFDAAVPEGSRGGPLVSTDDGRVIGVIGGRFDPQAISGVHAGKDALLPPNISYAVSVEYGAALLEAQEVEVI